MSNRNASIQDLQAQLQYLQTNADHFFLLVMACIIFLMQPGFAFLEAGSVRAKNTTNILLKNLLDVCIGAVAFWSVGYAFAFGGQANSFIGYRYFFFENMPSDLYSSFFFHFVFAATAATIVSGAMAERTEFSAYLVYSSAITGFIYPVVVHWAWSAEGWLAYGPGGMSYQDFAGSGVVHMVGGTAALVGAAIVGPRIGRFDSNGSNDMRGHTVPMVALGGFLLFFGFFAFNGGSQAQISQEGDGSVVALAIVNTIISGAFAALVAMGLRRLFLKGSYWSLLTAINGGLTGMVAICAGCNSVYPWGAAIIGVIGGVTYILWSRFMVRIKVDDPLDSVAVHLGGGIWGVLATPILSADTGIVFIISKDIAWKAFGWNLLGAVVIFVWTAVLSLLLFGLMHAFGILRVSPEIEIKGLDIPKHGEPAYPASSYGSGWEEMITPSTNGNMQGMYGHSNKGFHGDMVTGPPAYRRSSNIITELPL